MDYILKGHNFDDEVISLLQLFFPNNIYSRKADFSEIFSDMSVISFLEKNRCTASLYKNGKKVSEFCTDILSSDIKSVKRCIKISLFYCFKKVYDIKMPWGILTGIRPSKRIYSMWEDGISDSEIKKVLKFPYVFIGLKTFHFLL